VTNSDTSLTGVVSEKRSTITGASGATRLDGVHRGFDF
jgi:hypothetical protein